MQELMVDVRRSMFDFDCSNSYPETTKTITWLVLSTSPEAASMRGLYPSGLSNVRIQRSTAKSVELPTGTAASFACLLDVYHHLEYPITFMRSLKEALTPDGRVLVCDFHRDPSKVKSMPPSWALDHIRADQATFRAEIERAGFRLVASPSLPTLRENYLMVFERSDAASVC